jgi:hypothetical protein
VARRRAIERGCAWIAKKQNRGGSFGDNKALVAFTALSTLALMSEGSGVGRGTYGEQIRGGITWLVELVESPKEGSAVRYPPGYFHAPQDLSSKMHGQGYATLALASALGSADERLGARIRKVLTLAVRCAADSQTALGGWGYEPSQTVEHEGSVTVTVAQGLRAARRGREGPGRGDPPGLRYLRKSQKSSTAAHPTGPRTAPSSTAGTRPVDGADGGGDLGVLPVRGVRTPSADAGTGQAEERIQCASSTCAAGCATW